MKILIIEPSNSRYLIGGISKFEILIKQELIKQKNLMDTETEFISRDIQDLEDMLYEQSSCFLRKESALFFDTIDMIFINGHPSIACWNKKCELLCVLLRMCIRTNKLVFANGLGFFCFVMLCATDSEKGYFNVINGNGLGSKLKDIKNEVRLKKVLDENDVFLDAKTGDIYRYNADSKEWVPKGNMGIHKKIYSQIRDSDGVPNVLGSVTYKAKVHDRDVMFVTHKDESVIYLRKNSIHHWAVKGCPNKFLAMNDSPFEVHPFNFKNTTKTFQILAETPTAPQIILMSSGSILATQFMINKSYPETLKILANFIREKLLLLRSGKSSALSISVVDSTWYAKDHIEKDIKQQREKPFRHCGMTSSEKGHQFVENNAIMKSAHHAVVIDKSRRLGSQGRKTVSSMPWSAQHKDFNKMHREKVKQRQNFEKVKIKDEFDQSLLGRSETAVIREQMPEFEFRHSAAIKKSMYGDFRLLRSEGFDFDDGWVPGYKTKAKPLDPATSDGGPVRASGENKYIKELMERKLLEKEQQKELLSPIKPPIHSPSKSLLQANAYKDQDSVGTTGQEKTRLSLTPGVIEPTQLEKTVKHDPNEFVKRDVVVRRVEPQFFTRYNFFKKMNDEEKAGYFYYSQPYVDTVHKFR